MQRKAALIAVCLFALILGTIYTCKRGQRFDPSSSIELSQDQLAATTAAAKRGEAAAAGKLSRHFLVRKDYKHAYAWMLRAKQLGDPGAESDLNEMRQFMSADVIREAEKTATED